MRYLEAYPRIVAMEALSQWLHGRRHCSWRHEEGAIGARGWVDWQSTTRVMLSVEIGERSYIDPCLREFDFDVAYARTNHSMQARFICPKCHERKKQLVLFEGTAICTKCSGLRNKSATVPAATLAHEKIGLIDSIVRHGRPKNLSHQVYNELVMKRNEYFLRFPQLEDQRPVRLPTFALPEWSREAWWLL